MDAALIDLAMALQQAGRADEAQAAYGDALAGLAATLQRAPNDLEALFAQGVVFSALGRMAEAVTSFERVLALEPGLTQAAYNRAVALNALGRHVEALAAIDDLTAAAPQLADAWLARGIALHGLGRFEEALAAYDRVLATYPDFAVIWSNRGDALLSLERFAEALDAYDRSLALEPSAEGWRRRGEALTGLKRHEEAVASHQRAVALAPQDAAVRLRLADALAAQRRFPEALAVYDAALALDPGDVRAWSHRGQVLHTIQAFDAAQASLEKALALDPEDPGALQAYGKLLGEVGRVEEGMALFARRAARLYAEAAPDAPVPQSQLRHDREQADYLLGLGVRRPAHHIEGGERVAGPAVTPANGEAVAAAWAASDPKFVVIDDLLTPEALEGLRRYCWGSTVWRRPYSRGYLGAFSDHGFGAPLLAQIADELRQVFPTVIGEHGLVAAWAFKYDSRLDGIRIHADQAGVNVNFWITPDEANLDPDHGGMVIWNVAAPLDWEIERYNGDEAAVRAFLTAARAEAITVPYRANRAVIFDSNLFHETDRIDFADGYRNRRINVTMLYGRRTFVNS